MDHMAFLNGNTPVFWGHCQPDAVLAGDFTPPGFVTWLFRGADAGGALASMTALGTSKLRKARDPDGGTK
jgi:hypothetical protein